MNIALAAVIFILVALGGVALGTRTTGTASTSPTIESLGNATTTIAAPTSTSDGSTNGIKINANGDLKLKVLPLDNSSNKTQ